MTKWQGTAMAAICLSLLAGVPALAPLEAQATAEATKAVAGPKLKQAEAEAKVRAMFELDSAWQVELAQEEERVWSLYLTNGGSEGERLHAQIDVVSGALTSYQRHYLRTVAKEPLTEQKALAAAEWFRAQYLPDLELAPLQVGAMEPISEGPIGHERTWSTRVVGAAQSYQGLPFLNNQVRLRVDEQGRVTEMYKTYAHDTRELPPRFLAIPDEPAREMFAEPLVLDRWYELSEGKPVLSYRVRDFYVMDAITGQFLHQYSQLPYLASTPQRQPVRVTGTHAPRTAQTLAEATRLVTEQLGVDLSKHHVEEQTHHNYWTVSWYGDGYGENPPLPERLPKHVSAQFDRTTGVLLSMHRTTEDLMEIPKEPGFTLAEGRAKAIAYIQDRYAGEQELLVSGRDNRTPLAYPKWVDVQKAPGGGLVEAVNTYRYIFTPQHEGIPVRHGIVSVELNATTGQLVGLYSSAEAPLAADTVWPDAQAGMSPEAAKEQFLKLHPPVLAYVWPSLLNQSAPGPQLSYGLPYPHTLEGYLDARTGQWVATPGRR